MHPILTKLLNKRGITAREELSVEEKVDYEKWERILSGGVITIDKIVAFCKSQISLIEMQWKDFSNDSKKNERLIIAHTIYSTLLKVITSPEVERVTLEEYLNKLVQT